MKISFFRDLRTGFTINWGVHGMFSIGSTPFMYNDPWLDPFGYKLKGTKFRYSNYGLYYAFSWSEYYKKKGTWGSGREFWIVFWPSTNGVFKKIISFLEMLYWKYL